MCKRSIYNSAVVSHYAEQIELVCFLPLGIYEWPSAALNLNIGTGKAVCFLAYNA